MGVVYPKRNTVVSWSGGQTPVRTGDAWDDQAKLVREKPDLFTTEPTHLHGAPRGRVETATQAPGEKRGRSRSKKSSGDGAGTTSGEGETSGE